MLKCFPCVGKILERYVERFCILQQIWMALLNIFLFCPSYLYKYVTKIESSLLIHLVLKVFDIFYLSNWLIQANSFEMYFIVHYIYNLMYQYGGVLPTHTHVSRTCTLPNKTVLSWPLCLTDNAAWESLSYCLAVVTNQKDCRAFNVCILCREIIPRTQ